jgi:hypothetical protein
MDVKEIGWKIMDYLALARDHTASTCMNIVANLWIPEKTRNFLIN